ncbi:CHAP domain-containing protein [Pedococcus dokdonensis]|uniref:CHAP domain-containing protein n=1 Tax=Pedococcus dokdonensis TaxID=443156 RepID=A0A1H0MC74_9MICO|nr:CHAP domain-containing protein [Pedococcus dokdonensis]SDO78042.1 CHAP domain-containing protein [Pedococcus dokdonensis]
MRRHVLRAAARLAALALAATAVTATLAGPASAETMVRECKASSISCISFTGYAGKSVWGYPVSSNGNNCVNYVAYRLSKNGVKTQSGMGNGGSWASNATKRGFKVDKTAKVGSIAQWSYGSAYAPGYGHVGYVEEVTSAYIVISDSSYGGGYSSRWRVPRGDRNWPSNFIHFKDQAYKPPPSGSFVKVRETSQVFRLVGKAPVFVSTWTAFGGVQKTYLISSTSLATLPVRPTDGTFIKGAQRKEAYRIAGGAPVIVTSWAVFGGTKPTVVVDQNAIDKAGTGGAYNHLNAVPADGTFIKTGQRLEAYRISGGAPVAISSWANVGGYKTPVYVDQLAVDKAGTGGKFNHLRFHPKDGTIIKALPGTASYKVTAGVPVPTSTTTTGTGVDQVAIAKAGDTSELRWTHLAKKSS